MEDDVFFFPSMVLFFILRSLNPDESIESTDVTLTPSGSLCQILRFYVSVGGFLSAVFTLLREKMVAKCHKNGMCIVTMNMKIDPFGLHPSFLLLNERS